MARESVLPVGYCSLASSAVLTVLIVIKRFRHIKISSCLSLYDEIDDDDRIGLDLSWWLLTRASFDRLQFHGGHDCHDHAVDRARGVMTVMTTQ